MTLLDNFERLTHGLVRKPKALFPSELYLFYKQAILSDADMIVESGTGFGGSAEYFSRLFPHLTVVSVDRSASQTDAASAFIPHVIFMIGDGLKLLPKIIRKTSHHRVAVLIDGPKGQAAVDLAGDLLEDSKVVVIAIHDLELNCPGKYLIHSHAVPFRLEAGHLDAGLSPKVLAKHPKGPGLSLFFPVVHA